MLQVSLFDCFDWAGIFLLTRTLICLHWVENPFRNGIETLMMLTRVCIGVKLRNPVLLNDEGVGLKCFLLFTPKKDIRGEKLLS